MRYSLALLLLIPLALPAQTLPTLTPNHRVLLLFASSAQDPQYRDQLDQLKHHTAELKDRDVLLIPLLVDTAPVPADTLRVLPSSGISPQEQDTLRARYRIAPSQFTALLLGKDGGEKLRQQTPLSFTKLRDTIDAMPMRQQELRQRGTPQTPSGAPRDAALHQRQPQ